VSRGIDGVRLIVATHNRGKLEEIASLLDPFDIAISSNADFDLPEPEETGATFLENARIKARAAQKMTGLPALADDSGLEIDALGGRPGVYTADWAETPGGRDFVLAMSRAHDELVASGAPQPWRACFCCTLVLAQPGGRESVFVGQAEGRIVWPMRGDQGHGYDPIFLPDGYEATFGEMDRWEKNRISHRADAFGKFVTACF
jgi:XTP/dITP diphosphohydrolase